MRRVGVCLVYAVLLQASWSDRANSERAKHDGSDAPPRNTCLQQLVASCQPLVADIIPHPDELESIGGRILALGLRQACSRFLELDECVNRTTNARCTEHDRELMTSAQLRYLRATRNAVQFICVRHLAAFEDFVPSLLGQQLARAVERCIRPHQPNVELTPDICSYSWRVDRNCAVDAVRAHCGNSCAVYVSGLADNLLDDLECTSAAAAAAAAVERDVNRRVKRFLAELMRRSNNNNNNDNINSNK